MTFRIPCTIIFSLTIVVLLTAMQASAQTGVIAFQDGCTERLYAMRGDGSGRIELPLPPRPPPTDEYSYRQPRVLDVTTSGPLTVVYYVGISRQDSFELVDYGLFAVQLNEVGGMLTPDLPERLDLPSIAGVNPNRARNGSFSFTGDRLALAAGTVLMTGKVERDAALEIIGLSDLVVVLPDPGFPTLQGFTGTFDFSPDGTSIVASINDDLWMIDLNADHTFLGAERLTENTDGFAEWNPSFSPDGSRIAYSAGPITSSGGVRDLEIYSLTLASRAVLQVTTKKTKGEAASSRNAAMWSADSASIGFTAFTSRTPRGSPCSGLVNSEIFLIKADGSITATKITNTNGTGVEAWPKWGW